MVCLEARAQAAARLGPCLCLALQVGFATLGVYVKWRGGHRERQLCMRGENNGVYTLATAFYLNVT